MFQDRLVRVSAGVLGGFYGLERVPSGVMTVAFRGVGGRGRVWGRLPE